MRSRQFTRKRSCSRPTSWTPACAKRSATPTTPSSQESEESDPSVARREVAAAPLGLAPGPGPGLGRVADQAASALVAVPAALSRRRAPGGEVFELPVRAVGAGPEARQRADRRGL